jgi:uncharacterized protein (UPF0276 family)
MEHEMTSGVRSGGVGIGLRVRHYDALLASPPRVDFAEAISENFMGRGGRPRAVLERVRRDVPIVLHGVSLSVGGVAALDQDYLDALCELCAEIEPAWVSDHLCFGGFGGHYANDLWPLPYTEEAIEHVSQRVREVQDRLGRELVLENVSSYVEYTASTMPEWEFVSAVAERSDSGLLVDLNNVYVSAKNHGFDPEQYLTGLPKKRVRQFHLAGHFETGSYLLDNHGSAVPDAVWRLYRMALALFGPAPAIVEWDENLPTLERLVEEADKARWIASELAA